MKNSNDISQAFSLPENELHVWSISLIQTDEVLQKMTDFLDKNEKSKADRFKFEFDKKNYIVAHGAMRQIISGYLKCRSEEIYFKYTSYGKPFLSENESGFEFNLSHSKDLALLAAAKYKRVGIDIEYIRSGLDECTLAEQYFSPQENESLRNMDENLRTKAFFDCWTRKESFIKAIGKGLSYPLNKFNVSIKPADTAQTLFINHSINEAEEWQLINLNIDIEYSSAVVIESTNMKLKLLNWKFD
jgi:4'-phosphopantetheinyl transferase